MLVPESFAGIDDELSYLRKAVAHAKRKVCHFPSKSKNVTVLLSFIDTSTLQFTGHKAFLQIICLLITDFASS